jgi:iron complex transport system substrate-binding protein
VYYEIEASNPERPFALGAGNFSGDVLALAGGQNIFADLRRASEQVSVEQIVARDPEVILVGSPGHASELRHRPGWGGIAAVRTGRVFSIDGRSFALPGPRLAQALEEIARRLHPERFW